MLAGVCHHSALQFHHLADRPWFAQVADEYMLSLEENKKTKGRRQPLSKLPRHHPLVLQECGSDDGK